LKDRMAALQGRGAFGAIRGGGGGDCCASSCVILLPFVTLSTATLELKPWSPPRIWFGHCARPAAHPPVVEPRCRKVIFSSHVAFHGPPLCPRRAGYTAPRFRGVHECPDFCCIFLSRLCWKLIQCIMAVFCSAIVEGVSTCIATETKHPRCSILESRDQATSASWPDKQSHTDYLNSPTHFRSASLKSCVLSMQMVPYRPTTR
jgi:hypothetical protein